MDDYTVWPAHRQLTMHGDLAREFDSRISDSSKLVFAVAYSVLRSHADAEDVAQEVFAKAYRSYGSLRDRDRFRSWIVRITWRLALNRHRGNSRRERYESTVPDRIAPPTAMETVLTRERSEQLWKAIDCLPEKLRIVIVLFGIEEHDVGEVSRILNLPEGTIKSRLFHARKRLKEILQ
jgi:RNA polymerase sigma-70 factor (ECF subfamily)